MDELLRKKIVAAIEFCQRDLETRDMDAKGAALSVAQTQSRLGAFRDVLRWAEEKAIKSA